ncbi:MAG: efflux RND transporter periplasmic adaptor subunit [Candidatus Pristimantibacillus sp.]
MKKKIKWVIIGLILVAISVVLYTMSNPTKPAVSTVDSGAITFPVTKETITNTVEVKGKSLYEQETMVYAPYGSKVTEWSVKDGQQVKKGEVLFKLDQTGLENEITQEEAAIRKTELEAELNAYLNDLDETDLPLETNETDRKKALAQKEVARLTQELNDVTNGIQREGIAQKKAMLSKSQYRSPASGIFLYDNPTKRPQAVGDNEYIGKIVDLNKLQLIALVGEADVFRIKEGMPVEVKMNAIKTVKLAGKVLKVSKFAKSGTDTNSIDQAAQFEVVISLEPNEYLIAGLSLNGDIETSRKEDVIVVPTIAIMREQDLYYVMLDKGNGQYERKDIKIGLETSEKTEVLEGLKEGDQVVLQ